MRDIKIQNLELLELRDTCCNRFCFVKSCVFRFFFLLLLVVGVTVVMVVVLEGGVGVGVVCHEFVGQT